MKPLHDPVDVTGNGGPSRTIRQIWQRLSKLNVCLFSTTFNSKYICLHMKR